MPHLRSKVLYVQVSARQPPCVPSTPTHSITMSPLHKIYLQFTFQIKFSNVGLSSPFTLTQSIIASFTLLERSAFQFPQRMLVYLFISQHYDILLLNNMWVTLKLFFVLNELGIYISLLTCKAASIFNWNRKANI